MLKKILSAAVCVMLGLPSAAVAREHYVIITAHGFFPQIAYVQPGDVVYFRNDAAFAHQLTGIDADTPRWDVTVQPNDFAVIVVTDESATTYNSLTMPLEEGVLSFEEPPEAAQAN